MATYHDAKIKTAQAKEAVARAKARAPPPGPLLLVVALSLGCFLVSDYLLYTPCGDDGQPLDEEPVSLLQTYRQSCSPQSQRPCSASRVSLIYIYPR